MQTHPATSAIARIRDAGTELIRVRAALEEMLSCEAWDDRAQVEMAALRDDIEFLLIGHDWMGLPHDPIVDAIRHWFTSNAVVDQIRRLTATSVSDQTVLRSVLLDTARFSFPNDTVDLRNETEATSRAQVTISDVYRDLSELLMRLGAAPPQSSRLAFAALVANVDDVATRERLHTAWQQTRDRHRDELMAAVDARIEVQPIVSPLRPEEPQVDAFLRDLLELAIADSEALEHEMRRTFPGAVRPLDHYSRYSKLLLADTSPTERRVKVGDCLSHLATELNSELEICIQFDEALPSAVRITNAEGLMGEIILDLRPPGYSNRTIGLRNHTDYLGVEQHPIAYAQAGIIISHSDPEYISIQGAHSLLHEIGHGIQHILAYGLMPSLSGMDRLPVDRRESMALWCEKLLYRPGLIRSSKWKSVKAFEVRRGLVQRAVISIIDRTVFSSGPTTSVTDQFHELDHTHGISRFCELFDVLEHFAGGPSVTNDGSYYAYAIAAAASCEYAMRTPPQAWFDPDRPAPLPEAGAILRFYGGNQPA